MQPKRPEDYSARNALIIFTNRPDATQLAGFQQWRAMGRQVRKGEHGIRIAAPVTERDPDTGERRMRNVRGAVVFDIAQTDAIEDLEPATR